MTSTEGKGGNHAGCSRNVACRSVSLVVSRGFYRQQTKQLDSKLVNKLILSIRLCKWLKQLDSKLSPVKGFMGSNPLSLFTSII